MDAVTILAAAAFVAAVLALFLPAFRQGGGQLIELVQKENRALAVEKEELLKNHKSDDEKIRSLEGKVEVLEKRLSEKDEEIKTLKDDIATLVRLIKRIAPPLDSQQAEPSHDEIVRFKNWLAASFSESELRELAFAIGKTSDDAKSAVYLVELAKRNGLVPSLMAEARAMRPEKEGW